MNDMGKTETSYTREWRVYAAVVQMCKMGSIDHTAYGGHKGVNVGIA